MRAGQEVQPFRQISASHGVRLQVKSEKESSHESHRIAAMLSFARVVPPYLHLRRVMV